MHLVRIAARNLWRQKKRSVLLGAAIAFGVVIITLVGSFTAGLTRSAEATFTELLGGHVYVNGTELTGTGRRVAIIGDADLIESGLAEIEDEIVSLQYRSQGFGDAIFGSLEASIALEGVSWGEEEGLLDTLEVLDGDLSTLAGETGRSALVMPSSTAEELQVAAGDTIVVRLNTVTGQRNVGDFRVAAVIRDASSFGFSSAYVDRSYLNELIGLAPTQFQSVAIELRTIDAMDATADEVRRFIAAAGQLDPEQDPDAVDEDGGPQGGPPGPFAAFATGGRVEEEERWDGTRFSITTVNDVLEPVATLVGILEGASFGLFLVLMAITGVGLLNTFRMILIERTREIGTIRAVGMQRRAVRRMFLLEAVMLALAGAAAGLVVAGIAALILGQIRFQDVAGLALLLDRGRFAFPVNVGNLLLTISTLLAITVVSALLPARRAARLRPAEALRTTY